MTDSIQSTSTDENTCRVVVLVSGNGSNLQAIMDGAQGYEVVAVVCNRPGAYALERARGASIDAVTIDHTSYPSREAFDAVLADAIEGYNPDCVVLAGFMRILSDGFVKRFRGKLVNIHPSLLPKYTGLDTHQRALDAGDSEAGCSIHFVTEELDGGPCIAQGKVAIAADETATFLATKVLAVEHRMYPEVIRWFSQGRLELSASGVLMDGEPLPAGGKQL